MRAPQRRRPRASPLRVAGTARRACAAGSPASRRNAPPGVSIRSSPGSRRCDVRQRVDVERADDARIEALEIEHPDVAMHAGERFEHVPALLGGIHARVARRARSARRSSALQLAQVQEIERCDAGGDAIWRHAGQLAASERQRHDVELLDDLVARVAHRCVHRAQTREGRADSCARSRRCGRARRRQLPCLRPAPRAPPRRANSRPCARTRRAADRCRPAPARPGAMPGRCRSSLPACAGASAPESRPSSNGCRRRRAIFCSTVRSKSTMFQPVSTSGS